MKSEDIDLAQINPAMKGISVRVKPLFNIYDGGSITKYGLNIKEKDKKRFSSNKYSPFYFDTEEEAEKAAKIINDWSTQ